MKKRASDEDRGLISKSIGVIAFVTLVVVGYAIFLICVTWPIEEWSINKAGVFGDSFGIITALFSGLAFGGLIITILLQSHELRLQRQELSLTREQFHTNGFESTFFEMLRLYNEILNSIDVEDNDPKLSRVLRTVASIQNGTAQPDPIYFVAGRDCFSIFYNRLSSIYNQSTSDILDEKQRLVIAYEIFWGECSSELGHYYRYLYHILRFIDSAEIDDKFIYSAILCSQLSDQELVMLFYYCLYKKDDSLDFKALVEKYALFNDLPLDKLLNPEHRNYYERSAFGDDAP